jgi:hypothetical protein
MKVEFPVFLDGRTIMFSEEVETQADAFAFIASMQEVFGNLVCERNGKSSDSVKLRVRSGDDGNFYEMVCTRGDSECLGAKKAFGVHKKGGGLFPKSKDKDNNYLPNNGWMKWDKTQNKEV